MAEATSRERILSPLLREREHPPDDTPRAGTRGQRLGHISLALELQSRFLVVLHVQFIRAIHEGINNIPSPIRTRTGGEVRCFLTQLWTWRTMGPTNNDGMKSFDFEAGQPFLGGTECWAVCAKGWPGGSASCLLSASSSKLNNERWSRFKVACE